MSFAEALDQELAGTPWLYGPTGRAFVSVVAADQDTAIQQLKDVGTARDPLLAPVDYLPALSHDRLLPIPPIHELASLGIQQAWIANAHEFWQIAGSSAGYVRLFEPYGFDADTCQFLSNHEVGGYWDGNADWHSRVFGFLDATGGLFSTDGLWTDVDASAGLWSEDESPAGDTWDSNAKIGDLRYFRDAIRLTKGDYAYPVSVAVWLEGAGALPDGYWDSPGVYDDGDNWDEGDGLEQPLYWTLGHVWGEESWIGDGVDNWPSEGAAPLGENDVWDSFV